MDVGDQVASGNRCRDGFCHSRHIVAGLCSVPNALIFVYAMLVKTVSLTSSEIGSLSESVSVARQSNSRMRATAEITSLRSPEAEDQPGLTFN